MAISPMTKDKVMRPSLIDSVDKINEIIVAVNLLDPAEIDAIESRVDALETAVTSINTRLDNIAQSLVTINASIATMSSDIDNIKVTLYTPLSGNGGN
jgi:archaellum component FlaC